MIGGLAGGILAALTVLPLAWKWQLGVRRAGLAVLGTGLGAWVLTGVLPGSPPHVVQGALVWLFALIAAAGILLYRFYRNPKRTPPPREDVIVSPADGEVIYVRRARRGTLPVSTKQGRDYRLEELTRTPLRSSDAIVVGISMSFLDVHVNRAPIGGQVTLARHFSGLFGSLRRLEMVFENERATTIIERGDLQVAVVQIASRLVRQIASYVRPGQSVILGEPIGVIRLGSQVDLVLPMRDDLRVTVRPGDRVTAGESIAAVFEPWSTCGTADPCAAATQAVPTSST